MSEKQIPPYVTITEVAEACGIGRYKAEGLLDRCGLLEQPGGKGQRLASEDRIREELPSVHGRLYAWFVLGGKEAAERAAERPNEAGRGQSR